jgi:exodeoxyribonuclease VIII
LTGVIPFVSLAGMNHNLVKGKDPAFCAGMTEADYRNALGLSQSSLKIFSKSPAHYLASTEEKSEPSDAMILGSVFHAIMLQPEKALELYAVKLKVDGRSKEGKAYNENFAIENAGKFIINTEQEAQLIAMRRSILGHAKAVELLDNSDYKELPVFGTYFTPYGDVRLKGLIDAYDSERGFVNDIKTCEDASPEGFRKAIWERRYDLQNVQYDWLLNNAGKPVNQFNFICIEKKPPYAVAVYSISAKSLLKSAGYWDCLVLEYGACTSSGIWKAYSDDIVELSL